MSDAYRTADDDQAAALEWLSWSAQFAGEVAAGNRVIIRTDNAQSALVVLRQHMAPEVRAELARLISDEAVASEGAA